MASTRIMLLLFLIAVSTAVKDACGGTATPTRPTGNTGSTGATVAGEQATKDDVAKGTLPNRTVAPHFVDSYPLHGDVLAQSPDVVVINFNFNLNPASSMTVTRDGEDVSLGAVSISDNALSMRSPVLGSPADGTYHVEYSACWPDGSCHEADFGFVVDAKSVEDYVDLSGRPEVMVHMRDGQRFDPPRIIISPGTNVTWVNDDPFVHFVNSDPHPSHNVIAGLNSAALERGHELSYTFNEVGAWGYHCSAHYNLGMTAQVLVR